MRIHEEEVTEHPSFGLVQFNRIQGWANVADECAPFITQLYTGYPGRGVEFLAKNRPGVSVRHFAFADNYNLVSRMEPKDLSEYLAGMEGADYSRRVLGRWDV